MSPADGAAVPKPDALPRDVTPMKISLTRETSAELAALWIKGGTVPLLAQHFKTSEAAIIAALHEIGFGVSAEQERLPEQRERR